MRVLGIISRIVRDEDFFTLSVMIVSSLWGAAQIPQRNIGIEGLLSLLNSIIIAGEIIVEIIFIFLGSHGSHGALSALLAIGSILKDLCLGLELALATRFVGLEHLSSRTRCHDISWLKHIISRLYLLYGLFVHLKIFLLILVLGCFSHFLDLFLLQWHRWYLLESLIALLILKYLVGQWQLLLTLSLLELHSEQDVWTLIIW